MNRRWRNPVAIGAIALVSIVLLFLLGRHFAHLAGILLWLALILCPFMYILFRRRHPEHLAQVEDKVKEASRDAPYSSPLAQRLIELLA
jgi:hypothetical protein